VLAASQIEEVVDPGVLASSDTCRGYWVAVQAEKCRLPQHSYAFGKVVLMVLEPLDVAKNVNNMSGNTLWIRRTCKMNDKWKDYLLSSGLPLEYSTSQILNDLGFKGHSEYRYQRANEAGLDREFSVDILSSCELGQSGVNIYLLIECKYRHEGVKWLFTPDTPCAVGNNLRYLFITIDDFANACVNPDVLDNSVDRSRICGKGIEILSNDKNPKGISQGVYQLSFAAADLAVSLMKTQSLPFMVSPSIYVVIPVLVTTAQLWQMKRGVSIEDIKSATGIEGIAVHRRFVVLRTDTSLELQQFTYRRLTADSHWVDNVKETLRKKGKNWMLMFRWFTLYYPTLFLIVDYSHLKIVIEHLIQIFENPDIVKEF